MGQRQWQAAAHPPASRRAQGTRSELQPPAKGSAARQDLTRPRPGLSLRRRHHSQAVEPDHRIIGVFRTAKADGFRIVPADKKARAELRVRPGDDHGAQPGELVEAELVQDRGRGLLSARVRKRLGAADDQRNISLIAIHQHAIPDQFPPAVLAEASQLRPASRSGRHDLTRLALVTIDPPDARDHDDAVYAEPDDDPANRGGFRITVAIADVAAYVHPGTGLDREAASAAIPSTSPTGWCDAARAHLQRSVLAARARSGRHFACFMVFDATGNSASTASSGWSHARLPSSPTRKPGRRSTAAGRQNEAPARAVLQPLWAAYAALRRHADGARRSSSTSRNAG
jgi:ribonuclease R